MHSLDVHQHNMGRKNKKKQDKKKASIASLLPKEDDLTPTVPHTEPTSGYLKRDGESVEVNIEAWKVAANHGNAKAQFNLGVCYEDGEGVPRDMQQAVKYYTLAADQGFAPAQCNLGYCYKHGKGVPQDMQQAVKYYTLAADQGNAPAQFLLGGCYQNGYGVNQDASKALQWYQQAANHQHVPAIVKLSQASLSGCFASAGYTKDFLRAKHLHKHARALIAKSHDVEQETLRVLDLLAENIDKYLTCDNASCGKGTTSGVGSTKRTMKLRVCGGCKQAHYCSKECQTEDWKQRHKHVCKTL